MGQDKKKISNEKNGLTRDRILDVAEILFAHKGYHGVSVREITSAAQCNLAAVNYHFGNKQNLYLEVFRTRWLPRASRVHKCFREYLAANGTASPTAVVQSLAKAFLEGPLNDEERRRHHQLISGELAQPTKAFELVADRVLRPLFNSLLDDLRTAMPAGLEEEQLALNAFSILAMILYFNLARPFISSFTGATFDADFTNRLIDHIVEFSLKGLGANNKEISR